MRNHTILFPLLEFLALTHAEHKGPDGVYCAKVFGSYVSKLETSPSGMVHLYHASQTTTISIRNAVYYLDETTGLIKIQNDALKFGAREFPFIAHFWNLRYDAIADEVQMFSPASLSHIAFKARCNITKEPLLSPRPEGSIQRPLLYKEFCTSPQQELYGRFKFSGQSGFEAEFMSSGMTVSLYGIKYKLKGPNKRGIRKVRFQIPEHLPEVSEFPHLGYYFRLRYNLTARTMERHAVVVY